MPASIATSPIHTHINGVSPPLLGVWQDTSTQFCLYHCGIDQRHTVESPELKFLFLHISMYSSGMVRTKCTAWKVPGGKPRAVFVVSSSSSSSDDSNIVVLDSNNEVNIPCKQLILCHLLDTFLTNVALFYK